MLFDIKEKGSICVKSTSYCIDIDRESTCWI